MLSKLLIFIFTLVLITASAIGGIYLYKHTKPTSSTWEKGGPVTAKPISLNLEVGSPDDDSLTFESNIIISGKTAPDSQILISSEASDITIVSKKDGSFSTIFDLAEGINNIQITVFDINGSEKTIEKAVYYSKEKLQ